MKFEIYKGGNEYRWRRGAAIGEIVAHGESYTSKANCQAAIDLVKSATAATPVVDLT